MEVPPYYIIMAMIAMTIHIYLTNLVYRMASDSGMNAIGWALFYFVTIPVGFLLFWVARSGSSLAVSGSMKPADPSRERVIDARRDYSVAGPIEDILPKIPARFQDEKLKEMFFDEEWEKAARHVEDMETLARVDRKESLANDYRRMQFWIQEKRNPYKCASSTEKKSGGYR